MPEVDCEQDENDCGCDSDWCIDVQDEIEFGNERYAFDWYGCDDGVADDDFDCGLVHFDVVCLLDLSLCVHSTALMNVMILVGLALWIRISFLMIFILVEAVLFVVSFW